MVMRNSMMVLLLAVIFAACTLTQQTSVQETLLFGRVTILHVEDKETKDISEQCRIVIQHERSGQFLFFSKNTTSLSIEEGQIVKGNIPVGQVMVSALICTINDTPVTLSTRLVVDAVQPGVPVYIGDITLNIWPFLGKGDYQLQVRDQGKSTFALLKEKDKTINQTTFITSLLRI